VTLVTITKLKGTLLALINVVTLIMIRCQAICKNGKRCSKKVSENLCAIHNNEIECEDCGECPEVKNRIKLKNCGHYFCHKCLADSFYNYQWYDDFSTENVIKCPECDHDLCDIDWQWVTNYLCEAQILQRRILCVTYLCPGLYKSLGRFVNLGFQYTPPEIEAITRHYNTFNKTLYRPLPFNNDQVDIVYFHKFTGFFRWVSQGIFYGENTFYSFKYGDPEIRKLFPELQRELVEYVFHPSRIKNIEELDDM